LQPQSTRKTTPELPDFVTGGQPMGNRDSSRGSLSGRALTACVVALAFALVCREGLAQDPSSSCTPAVGRVVSLQGSVELQRAGAKGWEAVKRLDTLICAGDRMRTGALSRALLFVQPETIVRVDQNTAITLHQTDEAIEVEFFASELAAQVMGSKSQGAGYFITRFPKKFKVVTPHMNAAVEGTEFMVQLGPDATKLTVIEGKVSSESVATRAMQMVTAGQSIASGATGAGAIVAVIKPQDAVQWVLRYPPLSDGPSTATHAEELLQAGSVDEALAAIDETLAKDPGNADALALRAVIQIAKNDKAGAIESAAKATKSGAGNYRSWLALSYAQQASFDLDAALRSAVKAEDLQSDSSLAHARVAELYLSLGDPKRAEDAARAAIATDPEESSAHSMLGFVHLAQIDTKSARGDFASAIERDSFSAMPWLGLGLAMIRDGELVPGREQLEIAVALDPSNSLLRSYVGKAYYEENTKSRDVLASSQFGLARQLDPQDPTPAFYESVLTLSQNRPVAAIGNMREAIDKNGNRAVYRSKLQLDDDVAATTANLSGLYGTLGFDKLAILEAARAIEENPDNYSAHQLLASAYADVPRHDIARVSEVLQSQIRQPASNSAASPLLSVDNLGILRGSGPSQLGANEYTQLFNSDGFRIDVDALVGELGTLGDQFQFRALQGAWSTAFGQLHYETDGFVDGSAADKDIYDLMVQKQLDWGSSIQLDAKRTEFGIEENFDAFDPDGVLPVTINETADAFRLSGHHVSGESGDWIWTAAYEDRYRLLIFTPFDFPFADTDAETYSAEIQHSKDWGSIRTVSGIGYTDADNDFKIEGRTTNSRAANAYTYGQWTSTNEALRVNAGVAFDWYRLTNDGPEPGVSRDYLSPKLALTWTPRLGTTFRLAAMSSIRRPFIGSQTIEPTQLAGFNQFFSGYEGLYGDREGTISDRIALAFDQAITDTVFAGLEISHRDLDVPSITLDRDVRWQESTGHFYLYKTIDSLGGTGTLSTWSAVATLEGEYERSERPQILTGSEGIRDLETVRLPVAFRVFDARGLSVRLGATYVRQNGTFSAGDEFAVFKKDDDAVILDIAFDVRLPRRHGIVTVGVMNAGDEFIDLVETDVFNPRVATRRLAFLKVRFSY